MERTTGHPVPAGPAQGHPGVDDLDEIRPGEQLIEKILRDAASHNRKA